MIHYIMFSKLHLVHAHLLQRYKSRASEQGTLWDNYINLDVLYLVERLSSSKRFSMYGNYREDNILGPETASLEERSNIHCPFLQVSRTVYYRRLHCIQVTSVDRL